MRRFSESSFIFISTNARHQPGGVEEQWLPADGRHSPREGCARAAALPHAHADGRVGALAPGRPGRPLHPRQVERHSRSLPGCANTSSATCPSLAHSTGIEADLLLRWAARKVPVVKVAHTITDAPQGTRRRRPMNALMRRLDQVRDAQPGRRGVRARRERSPLEVRDAGVAAARVVVGTSILRCIATSLQTRGNE